ncbi:alpha/beta fold hydrolase [Clostridium cibarium]|uniref:Alpha/beta hydrolase n=1 Tax=Clostridium cibarium TaxID=2762247 RepID=A0ABR8PVT9_9CLOT|nr:alpha/beta fold hydrolase [Clostridium cibarium]MBD7912249.1 alpha/beta hydrolase [Clostridium cibarium]
MFKEFVENRQFNFQINRFLGGFYTDPEIKKDIDSVLPILTDTDAWYKSWRKLGEQSEEKGQFELAAAYYEAGNFYLRQNDPNKKYMYNKFKENFYKSYKELPLEHFQVPYENSFLSAVGVKFENSTKTLLIHGGYDSCLEEIIPCLAYFKGLGYDIIAFEGPGQGGALMNGLKFIHNWEKPVSAILDYFNLEEASILGCSWGGYFCLRAAAFEKRIKEVICYDIFYCGMDVISMSNKEMRDKLEKLLDNNEKDKINELMSAKMKGDIDFNWKICKGMDNTGTETPYDFLKAIRLHTMAGIEKFVDQDLLLLAGEEDQYVPIETLALLENNLVNAKSITKKVFTKETGGEQHCQAGRMDLAFDEIKKFLTR